jgi:hypothetical protein
MIVTIVVVSYIYAKDSQIIRLSRLGGLLNLILLVGIRVFQPIFIIPYASLRCSYL